MHAETGDTHRLVARIEILRRPCDLDVLIFFARHPRALLASEHLIAFLGYGVAEVAASLELLLDAGVLRRIPHRKHAVRLYLFDPGGSSGGWLPALLELASSRKGRLEIIWALRRAQSNRADEPVLDDAVESRGPYLVDRTATATTNRAQTSETHLTPERAEPGRRQRKHRSGNG